MQDTLPSYRFIEQPTVSIIMATYNREHLIMETLNSIEKQTYQNWECLIIDDGSTDNTGAVISRLLQKDNRFHYLPRSSGHKKGLSGCRNFGLEIARGNYVIFFDDDDIVHPQNLEICLEAFKKDRIDFCAYRKQAFYDNKYFISGEGQELMEEKRINKNDMEQILKNDIPLASCTVMWKKENFKGHFFNEDLMYAEEWECYSRIISNNKQGLFLKNILYYNRKHPQSNTGEFHNAIAQRVNSKILAIKLVLINLKEKKLLTPSLKQYFIRLGFSLKSYVIIQNSLDLTDAGKFEVLKYKLGFRFYFLLKPIFNLKSKLLNP